MAGLADTSFATLLTGEGAADLARAGGKASALARLAQHFRVPAFFVIPADVFTDDGLPQSVRDEIADALRVIGPGPYAVRSSGREEDGASGSHAGQFATELNIAASDVAEAAFRVWRSGFTETLSEYRIAKGLSGAPHPPSVLVQQMIAPRAAGVAFSADPVSGDRAIAVISAVEGLADRLVGGDVDGDSYRIGADDRTLDVDLVGPSPVLSEVERAEVAALARRAQAHFGSPQDIEWAIDGGGLHLLQSRPITTLSAAPPDAVADEAVVIWDNSNIVESYPGVVSPMTFTFARYVYSHVYQAFSRMMGVSRNAVDDHRAVFENMLGRVDGRVYYNLLNWYRALALFPGFKANRAFMEGMMGVSEALPEDLAEQIAPKEDNALARFLDNLSLARVGLGLVVRQLTIRPTIDKFYERLNAALAVPDAEIDAMPATRLAEQYRELEGRLLARWDAPLVNDFLCMIAFGAAQKAMTKWGGDDGVAHLSGVLIGQGDIISAEPAKLIREMGEIAAPDPVLVQRLTAGDRSAVSLSPELERRFDAYIAKFGDRCTQELKLESRTLHEDATQILKAVGAAAQSAGKPAAPVVATPALEDVVDDPLKRMIARWLVGWAKARVRDRENLRFERTRLFGRVRRIVLALGARLTEAGALDDPRDVFSLTIEELLGAVEGALVTTDLRRLVALRATETAAQLSRPDPPERFTVRGAHVTGLSALAAAAVAPDEGGDMRKGLGCCRGVVTAKVRVIEDPRVEALEPGEILVARHTDPGWIAVFANAAGVIAERGSLLSHSAIVAREMGVPCVVGLKGATQWLKSGDIVRLDGGAGTVERTAGADPAQTG